MPPQSILELDEAQRRLRQLEQDYTEIRELVGRLRHVRRSLESRAEMLEELGAAAQSQLTRGRAALTHIESTIAGLTAAGHAVVTQVDAARQRLIEAMDERHAALENRCSQWSEEQQRVFKALTEQHAADLAAIEARLHAQGNEVQQEAGRRLSATRQELRSLVDRRSFVGGAAIGIALLLAGYVLMGRMSESTAREGHTSQVLDSPRPADDVAEPSRADEPSASEKTPPPSAASPAPPDASGQQPRIWTDYRGRTARAVFQGFQDGTVYLRRPDNGRLCPIPLEGLSPADQAHVQRLAQLRR